MRPSFSKRCHRAVSGKAWIVDVTPISNNEIQGFLTHYLEAVTQRILARRESGVTESVPTFRCVGLRFQQMINDESGISDHLTLISNNGRQLAFAVV